MTESTEIGPIEIKRLRWQCRRGMREMDMLLERWLDQHYSHATSAQQAAFTRVLQLEDDQLWQHLLGASQPEDPECAQLITWISAAFAAPQ
jgi:antitoxin CptB